MDAWVAHVGTEHVELWSLDERIDHRHRDGGDVGVQLVLDLTVRSLDARMAHPVREDERPGHVVDRPCTAVTYRLIESARALEERLDRRLRVVVLRDVALEHDNVRSPLSNPLGRDSTHEGLQWRTTRRDRVHFDRPRWVLRRGQPCDVGPHPIVPEREAVPDEEQVVGAGWQFLALRGGRRTSQSAEQRQDDRPDQSQPLRAHSIPPSGSRGGFASGSTRSRRPVLGLCLIASRYH